MSQIKTNIAGRTVKHVVSLVFVLLMLTSSVVIGASLFGVTALAEEYTYEYFPQYTGTTNSFVFALDELGEISTYAYRQQIAILNGISDYNGKARENIQLLEWLREGKLRCSTVWRQQG